MSLQLSRQSIPCMNWSNEIVIFEEEYLALKGKGKDKRGFV